MFTIHLFTSDDWLIIQETPSHINLLSVSTSDLVCIVKFFHDFLLTLFFCFVSIYQAKGGRRRTAVRQRLFKLHLKRSRLVNPHALHTELESLHEAHEQLRANAEELLQVGVGQISSSFFFFFFKDYVLLALTIYALFARKHYSETRFVRTRLSTYIRLLRSLRRSRTSPIGLFLRFLCFG